MKRICSILLLSATVMAAEGSQTVHGVISDSMCGAKHDMMTGSPESECVKMCTKAFSTYVLYDGKTIWVLSNQKLAAKYPAQRVIVTGEADSETKHIKVSSIEPEKQ